MFLYFLIFILGLIIGSFLNCIIYRIELQEDMPKGSPQRKTVSFLRGKSFCPVCKHILPWQDLIPVFSFIFLKGRCRYCQKPISIQYPIVEIATGLLFLLIFNFQSIFNEFSIFNFINLIYYLIIACFLIIIFVYDLKHYLIPDKIIYPAIIIALIFNLQFLMLNQFSIFKFSILSSFGAAAFFLLIVLVSRGRWMGTGDIFLAFLMGLILGFPNILVALFSAFLIGSVIGVGLVFLNKKTLKSEIPFGPFLIFGTFLALFWGEEIISWYQGLFLI